MIFDEALTLDEPRVRAIRFNLKRGGSEGVERLEAFTKRVHEIADWHVELYVDSEDLADLYDILITLPASALVIWGYQEPVSLFFLGWLNGGLV